MVVTTQLKFRSLEIMKEGVYPLDHLHPSCFSMATIIHITGRLSTVLRRNRTRFSRLDGDSPKKGCPALNEFGLFHKRAVGLKRDGA